MTQKAPLIVVVSGTSGAGKSTLIRGTIAKLPNSEALFFDDFASLGTDIEEIKNWIKNGADPNWVETPNLAQRLHEIKSSPLHPDQPQVVILEEPFGKARDEIAPHVDMAAHLHLETDIAQARRLLRSIVKHQGSDPKPNDQDLIQNLHAQLAAFLAVGREAYGAAESNAKALADLVLDGNDTIDALVDQLHYAIKNKLTEYTE